MAAVTPSTGRDARQVLHPLHTIDEPNFPSSLRHHLQGNVVDEIIAMITAQQYAGLEALHSGIFYIIITLSKILKRIFLNVYRIVINLLNKTKKLTPGKDRAKGNISELRMCSVREVILISINVLTILRVLYAPLAPVHQRLQLLQLMWYSENKVKCIWLLLDCNL